MAGQGLVTTPLGGARPGQIRVFEHPDRPGFWLVKRIDAVDAGSMIVRSDNPEAPGAVDSRSFGPVDVDGSYRLLFAVPLRFM